MSERKKERKREMKRTHKLQLQLGNSNWRIQTDVGYFNVIALQDDVDEDEETLLRKEVFFMKSSSVCWSDYPIAKPWRAGKVMTALTPFVTTPNGSLLRLSLTKSSQAC